MIDINKEDHRRYFIEDGEDGFSPERNTYIIEETIKKYEATRKRKQKDFIDALSERSHAVASYLKSQAVQSSKPIEKYLGKRTLAYLRGEEIVSKLRILDPTISRLDVVNASKAQQRKKKA